MDSPRSRPETRAEMQVIYLGNRSKEMGKQDMEEGEANAEVC